MRKNHLVFLVRLGNHRLLTNKDRNRRNRPRTKVCSVLVPQQPHRPRSLQRIHSLSIKLQQLLNRARRQLLPVRTRLPLVQLVVSSLVLTHLLRHHLLCLETLITNPPRPDRRHCLEISTTNPPQPFLLQQLPRLELRRLRAQVRRRQQQLRHPISSQTQTRLLRRPRLRHLRLPRWLLVLQGLAILRVPPPDLRRVASPA